ncbi:hypothetical protein [Flindersiella endophytica]
MRGIATFVRFAMVSRKSTVSPTRFGQVAGASTVMAGRISRTGFPALASEDGPIVSPASRRCAAIPNAGRSALSNAPMRYRNRNIRCSPGGSSKSSVDGTGPLI